MYLFIEVFFCPAHVTASIKKKEIKTKLKPARVVFSRKHVSRMLGDMRRIFLGVSYLYSLSWDVAVGVTLENKDGSRGREREEAREG